MYGQFDVIGFAKSAAHLYRAIWLQNVDKASADRPPIGEHPVCHIVEHWDVQPSGKNERDVHVYTSGEGASVSLWANGKLLGSQTVHGFFGQAQDAAGKGGAPPANAVFSKVAYGSGGVLVAKCTAKDGSAIGTHTRKTSKKGTQLLLTVDAPSKATGTGEMLLTDGQDTAMVTAMVASADGTVDHMSTDMVTCKVLSGPGKVVASHNGDVRNHEPNLAPSHHAYHGYVRCMVRVTSNTVGARRLRQIDAEHGARGAQTTHDVQPAADSIVVEVSSPGMTSAKATIQLSGIVDAAGVLAAAATSVNDPLTGFSQM